MANVHDLLKHIWSNSDVKKPFFGIDDNSQLDFTALTRSKENPFVRQLMTFPYDRYLENGHPYAMLTEVMRIIAGLEVVSSVLFYFGQLRPGDSNWIFTPRDGSRGT